MTSSRRRAFPATAGRACLGAEALGLEEVLATGPEGRPAVEVGRPLASPGVGGRGLPGLPGARRGRSGPASGASRSSFTSVFSLRAGSVESETGAAVVKGDPSIASGGSPRNADVARSHFPRLRCRVTANVGGRPFDGIIERLAGDTGRSGSGTEMSRQRRRQLAVVLRGVQAQASTCAKQAICCSSVPGLAGA